MDAPKEPKPEPKKDNNTAAKVFDRAMNFIMRGNPAASFSAKSGEGYSSGADNGGLLPRVDPPPKKIWG